MYFMFMCKMFEYMNRSELWNLPYIEKFQICYIYIKTIFFMLLLLMHPLDKHCVEYYLSVRKSYSINSHTCIVK